MKFINPVTITDSNLVSTNVAENDYTAWSAVTTYSLAQRVISTATHKIYESAQNGNLNNAPTTDDGTWWIEISATNAWQMFDQGVGTQTANATSIVVTIAPGLATAVALLDIVASEIRVVVTEGLTTLYDQTTVVGDTTVLADWYEYFFMSISAAQSFSITGLPIYSGGEITVTLTAPIGVAAKCGTLAVGQLIEVGDTLAGARIGIVDYSRKETDEWGNTTVTVRNYARRVDAEVLAQNARIDYLTAQLANARATPCVWLVDDGATSAMTIYGFYKDWGISIPYPDNSQISIQIEGLT